ncbi:MAG TPA: hypothetical protein P5037_03390, partial [Candidatus Paceibacterota bacterium]|nr:hypothetical protein [Verrucomicrobiota bacterium]HQH03277.1 hypothetical protein [Verrucomicrobiota bacterium]HQJ49583.1 hypothetical protein [Verrucomicrobiota bacterium]HRY57409.1 hypothetical protein [Candidatus Paceibacterota bacterium]HRZ68556.1 hypothetical protein [Candidatus Paceibacterota bacterium]
TVLAMPLNTMQLLTGNGINGGGACQSECLSWVAGVEAFAKYCEISSYAQTTPPEASREAWFLPGKRHLP